MSDCRNALVQSIRESLSDVVDNETNELITQKIICILGDYEVTERVTDLAVYDDMNDRIVKRYCACLLVDGKSEKTIGTYRWAVNTFLKFIGKPVTEIGVYDIRFFLASEKQRGVSDRTLENIRSYLSTFFQWAAEEELIPKNPCTNIKPIKYASKERMPFSAVELDQLRNACRSLRERALVEILATSGVRVSELVSMDVSDIRFADLTVHVRHGKGAKERITYINDVARAYLQRYLVERDDNLPYLFRGRGGRMSAGGIRSLLHELGKRAGVDNVHPHRFRRTFATGLAARGMSVQEIQKLLGHTNIATTMQYICIDNTKVKASYQQYIA